MLLLLLLLFSLPSLAGDPACPANFEALNFSGAHSGLHWQSMGKLNRNTPPGTVLDFGGGDTFIFKKFLGEGLTTKIVEVDGARALRISKKGPDASSGAVGLPNTDVTGLLLLHDEIEKSGVPIVKVDHAASRAPKFVVVEKLNIQATLDDLVHPYPKSKHTLSDKEKDRAIKALDEFARKTWDYEYIGDFRGDQLGWDGKEWKIFDIGIGNAKLKNSKTKLNTFSTRYYVDDGNVNIVPAALEARLTDIITEERQRQAKAGWKNTAPYFERDKAVRQEFGDRLAARDKGDAATFFLAIDPGYSTKAGRKKLAKAKDNGYELNVFGVAEVGEKSALFPVRIGKHEGFIEVRSKVSDGDTFAGKIPLAKARGFTKDDVWAVGPDYTLVIKGAP